MVIVHAGLAAATSTPELVISDDEGKLLSSAAVDLMAQFDVAPDPKTRAIVGAIMALGTVYGPRAVLVRMRKAEEAKAKAAGADGLGTATVIMPDGMTGSTGFSVNTDPPQHGPAAAHVTPPVDQWPTKA